MAAYSRRSKFAIVFLLLIVFGCMNATRNSPLGTIEDPPYLAPGTTIRRYQPQEAVTLRRPPQILDNESDARTAIEDSEQQTDNENVQPSPRRSARPPAASQLTLKIDRPGIAQIGSRITYRIAVSNQGNAPAENVVVECRFERGFSFPGGTGEDVHRDVGTIPTGEQKEILLTLQAEQTGTHCARFQVLVDGEEAAWKQICVEIVAETVAVQILGPAHRTVGSRAEYSIKIENLSGNALSGVQVSLTHDAELVLREASKGAKIRQGHLSWNLGELDGRERIILQVEFECARSSDAACLLAEVAATELARVRRKKCLQIDTTQGLLDLRMSDADDPVVVGQEFAYSVEIHNLGAQVIRNLHLSLRVPPEIEYLDGELQLNGAKLKLAYRQSEGKVVFDPVASLAGDGVATIRLRCRALRVGDISVEASLTSELSQKAIATTEMTTIETET